jgi:hypothetical protein
VRIAAILDAGMGTRMSVAVLATLAMAGCGGEGDDGGARETATPTATATTVSSGSEEPRDDASEINALLRERATRLERGASIAGTSVGAQRARDRRAARRTRALSLEEVRFVPAEVQTAGDRAKLQVVLSYRVRGMRRPFRTPRKVTMRRNDDGWHVTSDRPRREPLPWEVAPFKAHRTRHVVLLAPRGMDTGALRSGLERAYRDIRRDLPSRDLPPSVLVIAAADARQAEQLTGRIAAGIIAVSNVSVEWGSPPALEVERVLAQRLIVVVDRWRRQDSTARHSTLVHEMTHTALDPDTSLRTPPWLVEGVAMYVSNDDRRAEARARAAGFAASMRLRRISKPNVIFRLRGDAQGAAYAIASAAAEEIVERRGNRGLFRLYDAFNDSTIPGRPGPRTTDRIMRRTIGISLAQLDAAAAGG